MPNIAIIVRQVGSPQEGDVLDIGFDVLVHGTSLRVQHSVTADLFGAPADVINERIRSAAREVLSSRFGIIVGPADAQRVFGGALETPG